MHLNYVFKDVISINYLLKKNRELKKFIFNIQYKKNGSLQLFSSLTNNLKKKKKKIDIKINNNMFIINKIQKIQKILNFKFLFKNLK
jgi:hypothetical protein